MASDASGGLFRSSIERRAQQRRFRRLYRKALGAGLTDLGLRLRNDTAASLWPGEEIVEDDAVLIASSGVQRKWDLDLGTWCWLVLTTERVRWTTWKQRAVTEVSLSDLTLAYSEDEIDTFRWPGKRDRVEAVTMQFPAKSKTRALLMERLDTD